MFELANVGVYCGRFVIALDNENALSLPSHA
jgi:hypothetical protein